MANDLSRYDFFDDENKFSSLDQPNILSYLNGLGFNATKTTLGRYTQLGLMLQPVNKRRRVSGQGRTFYNPISVIEYMTAFLLFKGSWKRIDSKEIRIPRLTADDVFFGRLLYLSGDKHIFDKYELHHDIYGFDVSEYVQGTLLQDKYREFGFADENFTTCLKDMNETNMTNDILAQYIAKFEISGQNEAEFKNSYASYNKIIYKTTFEALFEQYFEDILFGRVR